MVGELPLPLLHPFLPCSTIPASQKKLLETFNGTCVVIMENRFSYTNSKSGFPLTKTTTIGHFWYIRGQKFQWHQFWFRDLDSVCMHDMLTIVVKKIETFKNVSTQCMVFKKCLRQHNLEPASFQWLKKYSRTSEKQ